MPSISLPIATPQQRHDVEKLLHSLPKGETRKAAEAQLKAAEHSHSPTVTLDTGWLKGSAADAANALAAKWGAKTEGASWGRPGSGAAKPVPDLLAKYLEVGGGRGHDNAKAAELLAEISRRPKSQIDAAFDTLNNAVGASSGSARQLPEQQRYVLANLSGFMNHAPLASVDRMGADLRTPGSGVRELLAKYLELGGSKGNDTQEASRLLADIKSRPKSQIDAAFDEINNAVGESTGEEKKVAKREAFVLANIDGFLNGNPPPY